ncbi:hypothetical protein IGS68_00710 [Skermanella sp. TT6]|uniref:Uncharacterized protein n=1 Tax=Skermanella cutis TaxID=2775420 RepID=A0ABX7B8A2_9PROT|nr:hypothetical protein [Skermanella sp. TT6]QQP89835.1 hypothetical protein IGS68_00710 [Skermanella sp. TT6]
MTPELDFPQANENATPGMGAQGADNPPEAQVPVDEPLPPEAAPDLSLTTEGTEADDPEADEEAALGDRGGRPTGLLPNRTPDGDLCWPTPDRDSLQIGKFEGSYEPSRFIGALLRMDGRNGRSEIEIRETIGERISRPRRCHLMAERMAILHPFGGITKLGRLGRMLRNAAQPDGFKKMIAGEALELLKRYQFNNPAEKALPPECDVHPYYVVLKATAALDWRIHWDEVNRELMRIMRDEQLDQAIENIRQARRDPNYATFIGSGTNASGLLRARTHHAYPTSSLAKTPIGQLCDREMTPFLKKAGFGGIILESPGTPGKGYWKVPENMRELVQRAVAEAPITRVFASKEEWVDWFCEGLTGVQEGLLDGIEVNEDELDVAVPVSELTLEKLKAAISRHDPELAYKDELLGAIAEFG